VGTGIAGRLEQIAERGAFDEFFKAVAEWGGETLQFLAPKPGVPLLRGASSFTRFRG
jgi:hypothetical protein